jgi:hypothetical protein
VYCAWTERLPLFIAVSLKTNKPAWSAKELIKKRFRRPSANLCGKAIAFELDKAIDNAVLIKMYRKKRPTRGQALQMRHGAKKERRKYGK